MLETTIAGSLPKPAWLAKLRMLWAPWQLEGDALVEAKRDATMLALKEQEDAGMDIVSDGERGNRPSSGIVFGADCSGAGWSGCRSWSST